LLAAIEIRSNAAAAVPTTASVPYPSSAAAADTAVAVDSAVPLEVAWGGVSDDLFSAANPVVIGVTAKTNIPIITVAITFLIPLIPLLNLISKLK
jgi:hypothetical protein